MHVVVLEDFDMLTYALCFLESSKGGGHELLILIVRIVELKWE
jgi:hypothetical protein